ncbi:unnamed protein product [Paramecium sonneborni]|uniref:Uncharacterized protein n=1 Tax=Paramecium sonneborni TaxID=65129 RepID=A0A8S1KK02_9CILI|nr:unnamed protein product [Paramecium sonneborni]
MQLIEQRAYELVDLCQYYDNHNYNIDQKKNDQESTVSNQDDQTMKDYQLEQRMKRRLKRL